MVLYWSCERTVCSSSRPSGITGASNSFAVKFAFPVAVGNVRESRGACGSANPEPRRIRVLNWSNPGITRSIRSRIRS